MTLALDLKSLRLTLVVLEVPAGGWKVGREFSREKGASEAVLESAEAGERDEAAKKNMKGRRRRRPWGGPYCPRPYFSGTLPRLGMLVPPVNRFADASVQPLFLACASSLSYWISTVAKRSY